MFYETRRKTQAFESAPTTLVIECPTRRYILMSTVDEWPRIAELKSF